MKAIIDADECTACGVCEEICPEVFKLGDDVTEVIGASIPEDAEEAAKEAADECPVECITIEE
ncbi:MAG: ferredoxin [Armatimonadetes bacterium CG_4_10_14_3_um_filter_66_18]|nr:ferredoxin [Armatimonadota bacterium]OIP12625.1 MAG: ferredoxin [Armatimonadetes bacterium CG2_30_66_41]PIU89002.1 MAG: ferredoxin [Armatimonadetes bacterium CG06_land_8_20_14_3_00_66_21]PIY48924.1 MAG: ferredoxin [Armatimonadetes bacterium CG_4_10_14_3_um_filter_66_18]PIZ34838.1 MAG: ferredoxin [Armatimonadetes bacterium CG_4_10_14_0_8_um_filter_66_14]